MGAITVDRPDSLAQEVAAEKCVGEGGHLFERTGERYQGGDFEVQCERCYIMGWEKPDAGDEPQSAKTILPGDTPDDGPRMRMARTVRRRQLDHTHRPR